MNDMMNLTTTTMTMSSLEIAEVTGKRHDNVLRDIEVYKGTGESNDRQV